MEMEATDARGVVCLSVRCKLFLGPIYKIERKQKSGIYVGIVFRKAFADRWPRAAVCIVQQNAGAGAGTWVVQTPGVSAPRVNG